MQDEELKYCQSCGMPLVQPEEIATEADGSFNDEYCIYCYKGGAFTSDCTMEQMIAQCAQFADQFEGEDGRTYTREEAVEAMREYFPMLKRWAK